MNLDIKHFKNSLSDYHYLKGKIAKIEDLRLELEVKRGVHAIRYDKEGTQGSIDPLEAALNKLNDTEKASYLDSQLEKYKKRLQYIYDFLVWSEYGESVMKIHCLGTSTYDKEGDRLHYSSKTLKRKVNKDIMNFLRK